MGPVDPLGFFSFIRSDPETRNWKNIFFLTGGQVEEAGADSSTSRYSFLGMKPHLILKTMESGTESTVIDPKTIHFEVSTEHPMDRLNEVLRQFRVKKPQRSQVPGIDRLPPFVGGGIGYVGFNTVHGHDCPAGSQDDLGLPDMYFVFYNGMYVFDHNSGAVMVCSTGFPAKGAEFKDEAMKEQAFMMALLDKYMELPEEEKKAPNVFDREPEPEKPEPSMSKIQALWGLQKSREALFQGDAWAVHFSQEVVAEDFHDPFGHFMSMTVVHPARYASYLNCENFDIISHSSERFFALRGKNLKMEPVCAILDPTPHEYDTDPVEVMERAAAKEPAPTKANVVTDAILDISEGLCKPGSLTVDDQMIIQPKPWGAILKAKLTGTIGAKFGAVEIMKVLFPPVTTSGYPRDHALDLISEVERKKRSIFGGCIGYFGYDGNCDLCTITDTLVHRSGNAYASSGILLVARSSIEEEYDLMIRRARAMVAAPTTLRGIFPFLAWRVELSDDETFLNKYKPFRGDESR